MQFKHPEILWALFLLLIPILIHLFQLRRFKRTPFTNVAMLQKVISESRKSNTLKKWLLLLSRMLLLACLIIAFAQPFFAKKTALQEKEMVVYLDDSFSMQARKDGFTLLETALQDIIKVMPSESKFSLFTNHKTFKDVSLKGVQNRLLGITSQSKQLTYNEVVLKAKTLFSKSKATQKNLIFISDFQESLGELKKDTLRDIVVNLVHLKPEHTSNIAIDSVYYKNAVGDQIEIGIDISGLIEDQSIPISIFNKNSLIAKTAVEYTSNLKTSTTVSLPKDEAIQGRISISDNSLMYDNDFYFNIGAKDKIKVLAVSEANAVFLERIYTEEEFEFQNYVLKNLNYSKIDANNLVVLNGLKTIPTSLQTVLIAFQKKGGSLVIIPNKEIDVDAYNTLLSSLFLCRYTKENLQEQKITDIAYKHPLLANVFEKEVSNFDYPLVKSYWSVSTTSPKIISYANGAPFLIGSANTFVFTAPLDKESSNFKNAPLIVPTFYNMGLKSLKVPQLYIPIGVNTTIDLANKITKDNVLKLIKPDVEFIPLQQAYANKVSLTFIDNPNKDGIYSIANGKDTLSNLAFNFKRDESLLRYTNSANVGAKTIQESIPKVFEELAKDNSIAQYWKWFVIFAIVFALVEVLIQKFLA